METPVVLPVQYIKFNTKRCFGIELEVARNVTINRLVDAVKLADPKRECRGTSSYCQDSGNNYWHVKFDRSCGSRQGEGGWEVASYKASGAKDLVKISDMGKVLKAAGAQINDNCGYHIHAELADFNSGQAATLVATWMKIEPLIMEMCPPNRRNNIYCRPLRTAKPCTEKQAQDPTTFWMTVRPNGFDNNERRVSLNMANYAMGGAAKRTAELRLPEGTLDPKDIKNWARLFVHFVNFTKKQKYPGNITPVTDVRGAVTLLGLHNEDPFFILSKGLYETKTWFLSRIQKYSSKKALRAEAKDFLAFIIPPEDESELVPIAGKPKKKKQPSSLLDDSEFWVPYNE